MQECSGKKKKKTVDKISFILLMLVFTTGLAVMMYPIVSDYINSKHQSRSIETYDETINKMNDDEYIDIFNKANKYNEKLFQTGGLFGISGDNEEYNSIMNINNTGVIGYLTIPVIKTELPLYHGTDDSVLNVAAGHLQGSSFPVGGENTHAVISAHRGLPTSRLFTDLDKIEIGDVFTITVLNKVLTYEVDNIKIVEPHMTDDLRIKKGSDYVTLVTCTPYGINTHRLLVRGQRVTTSEGKPVSNLRISSEAVLIDPNEVAVIMSVPIIIVLFIVSLTTGYLKDRRKKNNSVKKKMGAGKMDEKK